MEEIFYNKKFFFEYMDGRVEEIKPIIVESCMNPGQKTIIPVKHVKEEGKDSFIVSNTYQSIEVKDMKEYKAIYTEDYEPKIERHSCSECTNCGRC